ncbi:hypothetical protein Emed_001949 [Eimeria media]
MVLETAADSGGLQEESEMGRDGSAPDTPSPSQGGQPQHDLFEALNVDELYPPLSLSRPSFSEVIETRGQPWGAVSKLRHPFAPLLIVLLAVVIASSGILLARRKRREAPLGSSVGEEERAVESPAPAEAPPVSPVGEEEKAVESPAPTEASPGPPVGEEERAVELPRPTQASPVSRVEEERTVESPPPAESPVPPSEAPVPSEKTTVEAEEPALDKTDESKQPEAAPGAAVVDPKEDKPPEVGDEVSASSMRKLEEQIIEEFEKMLSGKAPEEVAPDFLGNFEKALKHFRSFVSQYKADLEGGEEKDEAARKRKRRWTLYKMQMATVTEKETEAVKQLFLRHPEYGMGEGLRELEVKLQDVYRLKITNARMWMNLAAEDGLHPDSSKSETVLNLLKAQELHYWRLLNKRTPDVGLPPPEGVDPNIDTWYQFKELCEKLEEEDYWLISTVP